MAFRQHEASACHKLATEQLLTLPATNMDVGEMLCKGLMTQRANNRHCLLKVLSSWKFLARQGCGIRGHDDNCDGNLYQLVKLISQDDIKVLVANYHVLHFTRFHYNCRVKSG